MKNATATSGMSALRPSGKEADSAVDMTNNDVGVGIGNVHRQKGIFASDAKGEFSSLKGCIGAGLGGQLDFSSAG